MARASYLIVSLSGGNSQSRALQTGGVRWLSYTEEEEGAAKQEDDDDNLQLCILRQMPLYKNLSSLTLCRGLKCVWILSTQWEKSG